MEAIAISGTSRFTVGYADSSYKASLSDNIAGTTCVEDLPLGITITVVYTVITHDELPKEQFEHEVKPVALSSSTFSDSKASPFDHQLYLVEKRTVTALKPTMLFLKLGNEGIIMKTRDLLQVLNNLNGSEKDFSSAIGSLNLTATDKD